MSASSTSPEQGKTGPSRPTQVGTVTSIAGKQSVVVRVDRRVLHPLYHKIISRKGKFMAHDERDECRVGDVVEIVSARPLSARKRWRVRTVLVRAGGRAAETEA